MLNPLRDSSQIEIENNYLSKMEPNIKNKIVRLLDEMPQDLLEEVFVVLENYVEEKPNKIKLSRNLNKILEEDQNLLQRLAK